MGKKGSPNWNVVAGIAVSVPRDFYAFQRGYGWIYAAQEDGAPLVKIGFTQMFDVKERLSNLWVEFRVPLTLLAAVYVESEVRLVERQLHRILTPWRIEREWFYLYMDQATLEALVAETVCLLAGRG